MRCYDWSSFHPGHDRAVCSSNGCCFVTCLDCGITAEMESVSAKISPADAYQADPKMRKAQGKVSDGVPFGGIVEK